MSSALGSGVRRGTWIALIATVAVAALALAYSRLTRRSAPVATAASRTDSDYATTIQPVLNRRCVVCHSCSDAPCQLNLQSFDGLDRGANPTRVYEPSRLLAIHPTRMFEDAQSTAEWRTRFGFFPVVERRTPSSASLEDSLLWRVIDQRRTTPVPTSVRIDDPWVCPARVSALDAELRTLPGKGMPYGFPALTDGEAHALEGWLRGGAGGPASVRENDAANAAIERWEAFLNAEDSKSRIVARYLYEHLFLAHLALEQAPGEWFRLVRSRTASPAPFDPIATVRPFDAPGVPRVYYRLRRVTETIVEKTHAPYLLSDAKLARLRQLFFENDWTSASPSFPSYDSDVAANPFVAFAAIPARARYQFLLDDAYYYVRTFIHGPVCKGQVALDVIDEHFLIFFLAPSSDVSVTHADFLPRVAADLAVPAEGGDGIEAVYSRFKLHELSYLKKRAAFLRQTGAPGQTLRDIWNGDGTNPDAVLTVYRHFDSASVVRGPVGGVPKTAWVVDYPILERLYYDLVAGFDVFGNLVHQLSTRRYMNLLRIEGESLFLTFLPASQRTALRDSWYRPHGVSDIVNVLDPLYAAPETQVVYSDPTRAKDEIVLRLVSRELPRQVVGSRESVQWEDVPIAGDDAAARFERSARQFVRKKGAFVAAFPDATLLRVRTTAPDGDAIYTIVRNKEHLNIDFMFLENEERVPAEDTLHVVRGVAASRPNLFLVLEPEQAERFAADVTAIGSGGWTWAQFLDRYGVRRNDPVFWSVSDFFNDGFAQADPIDAGVLDLSRYVND
jgi:hypothetical protein